eukprot:gene27941-36807_t
MNPNNLQSAIHVFRRLLESRESDCDEVLQSLKGLSSILNSIVSVTASDALLTDLSPSNRCGYHSTSVGHKIVAKLYLDAESAFSHMSTLLKRLKEQEYGFILSSNNALNLAQGNNVMAEASMAVDQLLLMQTLQRQLSLELRRKLELCGRLWDCADYMLDPSRRAAADHAPTQLAVDQLLGEALLQWPDSCPLSFLSPPLVQEFLSRAARDC